MDTFGFDGGKYHLITSTYRDRVSYTFRDNLPNIQNGTILDMGCSSGYTTEELSKRYIDSIIIGMDINAGFVQDANRRREGRYVVGDGYCPPFRSGVFDAVFAMNNLYDKALDLEESELREIMKNIAGVVKRGGLILISGITRASGQHIIKDGNENDYIVLRLQEDFEIADSMIRGEDSERRICRILESLKSKI